MKVYTKALQSHGSAAAAAALRHVVAVAAAVVLTLGILQSAAQAAPATPSSSAAGPVAFNVSVVRMSAGMMPATVAVQLGAQVSLLGAKCAMYFEGDGLSFDKCMLPLDRPANSSDGLNFAVRAAPSYTASSIRHSTALNSRILCDGASPLHGFESHLPVEYENVAYKICNATQGFLTLFGQTEHVPHVPDGEYYLFQSPSITVQARMLNMGKESALVREVLVSTLYDQLVFNSSAKSNDMILSLLHPQLHDVELSRALETENSVEYKIVFSDSTLLKISVTRAHNHTAGSISMALYMSTGDDASTAGACGSSSGVPEALFRTSQGNVLSYSQVMAPGLAEPGTKSALGAFFASWAVPHGFSIQNCAIEGCISTGPTSKNPVRETSLPRMSACKFPDAVKALQRRQVSLLAQDSPDDYSFFQSPQESTQVLPRSSDRSSGEFEILKQNSYPEHFNHRPQFMPMHVYARENYYPENFYQRPAMMPMQAYARQNSPNYVITSRKITIRKTIYKPKTATTNSPTTTLTSNEVKPSMSTPFLNLIPTLSPLSSLPAAVAPTQSILSLATSAPAVVSIAPRQSVMSLATSAPPAISIAPTQSIMSLATSALPIISIAPTQSIMSLATSAPPITSDELARLSSVAALNNGNSFPNQLSLPSESNSNLEATPLPNSSLPISKQPVVSSSNTRHKLSAYANDVSQTARINSARRQCDQAIGTAPAGCNVLRSRFVEECVIAAARSRNPGAACQKSRDAYQAAILLDLKSQARILQAVPRKRELRKVRAPQSAYGAVRQTKA